MIKIKVNCPNCGKEHVVEISTYKDMWQEALSVLENKKSSKDDIAWATDTVNDETFQKLKDSNELIDDFFDVVPFDCGCESKHFYLNEIPNSKNLAIGAQRQQLIEEGL